MGEQPDFSHHNTTQGTSNEVHSALHLLEKNLFVRASELLIKVTIATKEPSGRIKWVTLDPSYHSILVRTAIATVKANGNGTLHSVASIKEALFIFLLDILNGKPQHRFFSQAEQEQDTGRGTNHKPTQPIQKVSRTPNSKPSTTPQPLPQPPPPHTHILRSHPKPPTLLPPTPPPAPTTTVDPPPVSPTWKPNIMEELLHFTETLCQHEQSEEIECEALLEEAMETEEKKGKAGCKAMVNTKVTQPAKCKMTSNASSTTTHPMTRALKGRIKT